MKYLKSNLSEFDNLFFFSVLSLAVICYISCWQTIVWVRLLSTNRSLLTWILWPCQHRVICAFLLVNCLIVKAALAHEVVGQSVYGWLKQLLLVFLWCLNNFVGRHHAGVGPVHKLNFLTSGSLRHWLLCFSKWLKLRKLLQNRLTSWATSNQGGEYRSFIGLPCPQLFHWKIFCLSL